MKKVILITGASSGMGKATAKQLIKEGHTVYCVARRVDQMQDLSEMGGQVMAMDMHDDDSMQQVVSHILATEKRIDVLINNAGFAIYGSVEDTPVDEARRQFEVNLFGLGRLTQLVIPHMRNAGKGTIINISSMGGKMYTPLGAWYHASKHAVEGWSDCLRLELKAFGIDVVIIEPGIIHTEFGDVMLEPMVKRSTGRAYEKLAAKVAASTNDYYIKGNASPASLIAGVISKAIQAKRPKTRYRAGKMAKLLVFIRVYFGDRIYDRAVMSQLK